MIRSLCIIKGGGKETVAPCYVVGIFDWHASVFPSTTLRYVSSPLPVFYPVPLIFNVLILVSVLVPASAIYDFPGWI